MREAQRLEIISRLTRLDPIAPGSLKPRLKIPGPIRAVLFDIYGTLLISGSGDISHHAKLNSGGNDSGHARPGVVKIGELLENCGYKASKQLSFHLLGGTLRQKIAERREQMRAGGIEHPEVDIRDIWKKTLDTLWEGGLLLEPPSPLFVDLLALRYELAVNPVWPMPGFPSIIRELRDSGLRIGIVSNAQFYTPLVLQAICDKAISQIGFEEKLCSWSYKLSEAKPSINIFKAPLAQLAKDQIKAAEVLYIGNDKLNDMASASGIGCKTALFAGDKRSLRLREGNPEADIEPDMVITELSELRVLKNQRIKEEGNGQQERTSK